MVIATPVHPSIPTEPPAELLNAILNMYFEETISLESIAQENHISMLTLADFLDHPTTQAIITRWQRLQEQRVAVIASRRSMFAIHTMHSTMSRGTNQRLCVSAANAMFKAAGKSPVPRKRKKSSPRQSQPGLHAAIPAAPLRSRRFFAPIRRLVRHAPYHRPI